MKYALPVLAALALAIPATAMAAKPDMSCVKGDCKKTDPAALATQEMYKAAGQQPPDIPVEAPVATPEETTSAAKLPPPAPDESRIDTNLGYMSPNSAISEIAKAVERDEANRMVTPAIVGQETCSGFKAQMEAQRTHPYTAELQRGWATNREKIVAYGDQLRQEQLAVRQKTIAYGAELNAEQERNIADHVRYSNELAHRGLEMRQQMLAYEDELKVRQQLMRCPTPDMFANQYK